MKRKGSAMRKLVTFKDSSSKIIEMDDEANSDNSTPVVKQRKMANIVMSVDDVEQQQQQQR
jgi:hypothetical protein